jgi:hypothetical protein
MTPTRRGERPELGSADGRRTAADAAGGTPALVEGLALREGGTPRHASRARLPYATHAQRQRNFCYRTLAALYSRQSCVFT